MVAQRLKSFKLKFPDRFQVMGTEVGRRIRFHRPVLEGYRRAVNSYYRYLFFDFRCGVLAVEPWLPTNRAVLLARLSQPNLLS
jgi:hypothetical protein